MSSTAKPRGPARRQRAPPHGRLLQTGTPWGSAPPDITEGNRAYRAAAYFGILGFDPLHMFNAQGNAVDPESVLQVLGWAVHDWVVGELRLEPHAYPEPAKIFHIFAELK